MAADIPSRRRKPDAGAVGPRRDADAEGGDPRVSTTLARGLRILGAFRGSDGGPISNKEIAARSGLPKATVSRLIYTLVALGFVSQDKRSGGFLLAAGVLAPAYAFLANLDVRTVARPLMRRLARHPNLTITLTTRHELRMTTIEAVLAEGLVPMGSFGGSVPIARTALGHAYLAGLRADARAALMARMAAQYPGDWPEIERRIGRDVAAVERKGYCVVLGEWRADINGVAAPVVIDEGDFVLSISAGGPAKLLPADSLKRIGEELADICREIERAVGRPVRR